MDDSQLASAAQISPRGFSVVETVAFFWTVVVGGRDVGGVVEGGVGNVVVVVLADAAAAREAARLARISSERSSRSLLSIFRGGIVSVETTGLS